ncbi:L10-interacting MYB domain-containing protein-like [Nymphaea colorata]|nr:L10-interacting MYB domain-containing protein-like [Nymphaea colorata]XP_031501573.1 L10-interacting MYB domain-containing protein-like [Nymphaea colorata]
MSMLPRIPQDSDRADWTTARSQFLVEQLIEQLIYGNKNDSGFTKEAWKMVCASFNRKFNLNYTTTQLKSHFKILRKQYELVKLLRSQSGFGWDDVYKVVTAEEDVWDRYIAINSDAKNYKNKCFPLFDQCATLFDGKKIEGRETLSIIRNAEAGTRSSNMSENNEDDEASYGYAITPRHQKRRFSASSSRREKRVKSDPELMMPLAVENVVPFDYSSDSRAVQKSTRASEPSVQECLEELQRLPGLDRKDKVKATRLFRDPFNRVAFMTYEEDLRREWLLNELENM